MLCCKCVEHGWANKLPGELEDNDGNKYCILHAPVGHPSKSIDRFNTGIDEHVSSCVLKNSCQLSGVIFPGNFSFFDRGFKSKSFDIDLSHAVFHGNADGSNCTFSGKIDFSCTEFKKIAKFEKAHFKKNVIFTNSRFMKELNFEGAEIASIQFEKCIFESAAYFKDMTCLHMYMTTCIFRQSLISDGAKFKENSTFRNVRFRSVARFLHAHFWGDVLLDRCKFRGREDFGACTFENIFLCQATDFLSSLNFSFCTFLKSATFQSCLLLKDSIFNNSTFTEDFSFKFTQIDGDINFFKATFLGLSDFSGTIFNGNATFEEAIFDKKVSFGIAEIRSSTDWSSKRSKDSKRPVYFGGNAIFSYAEFRSELYFNKTIFDGVAHFDYAKFIGKSFFNNVHFDGDACFDGTLISDAMSLWNNSVTKLPGSGEISFKDSTITNQVKISQARLDKFNMYDVDLSKFYFYCCEWKKDKNGINSIFQDTGQSFEKSRKEEIIYRSLKKAALDNKDNIAASDWHYQEKKACRNKLKLAKRKSVDEHVINISLIFYRFLSGYGERPSRSFCWLFIIIISIFLLLLFPKLRAIDTPLKELTVEVLRPIFCEVSHDFFNMILFPSMPKNGRNILYYFALFFSRVFLPIQIAFIIFSLRNKLRR